MLFDLILMIDSTGSMSGMINTAKAQMSEMVKKVSSAGVEAKYSLISYRDHPPNEKTWPSKIYANRVNSEEIIRAIKRLDLGGGGDSAESGFDAIREIENLSWGNEQSLRLGFFIGDAPIKGTIGAQKHSTGNEKINKDNMCPCGLTLSDIERILEKYGVELHGLVVNSALDTKKSFDQFCMTVSPSSASSALGDVLEFVKKYESIYTWSRERLLPILESNPRMSIVDLSKLLETNLSSVGYGIELLNRFGFTEHLLGGAV